MQAKALRSAVDSGLEVPPEVIDLAIRSVREHYASKGRPRPARIGAAEAARPVHLQQRGRRRHDRHGRGRRRLPAGVRPVRRLADRQEHGGDRGRHSGDAAGPQPRRLDAVRRLHAVLRRPGALSGQRRPLEGQLSAAARLPGRFAGDRPATIRSGIGAWRDHGAKRRRPRRRQGRRAVRAPASPASSWRFPIATCRSCRKARSRVSEGGHDRHRAS